MVCVWLLLWWVAPARAADPVKLVVTGVQGAALVNVREALALPPGLVREGTVDRLWLDYFAGQVEAKVRTALEPFGYYEARVTSVVEPAGEGAYRLRVAIVPGKPVRITELTVDVRGPGAQEKRLKRDLAAFPLHKGGVLLQRAYEEAKGRMLADALDLAYLDATYSVHEIRISPAAHTARVVLVLETGTQYLFDGVRFEGASDYPEPFLRRYVTFRAGDRFSQSLLGETQLNLTNSERFKKVLITPQKEDARGFRVPVLVQLTPAARRSLRPGVGYGTDTGFRFSTRYRDLNLFHRGHELDINLYLAERLQGVAAGYTIPGSRDIRTSTVLRLNLQREDVSSYVSRLAAVELDVNRSFGKGELGTVYVKLQQEDFTIAGQDSSNRLVLPGIRFSGNRFDSLIRPRRGYRYALEVRGTNRYFGSDTQLLQFVAEGSHVLPLPWRLSLHSRARAGITAVSDPLHDLPPSLRFFAGGDRSVRGYAYQSLGPTDAAGQVLGGKHLLVGSVELERGLFKDWGVSVFYDAGNAFDSFTNVRLAQGAGVGAHYYTRIGSFNLYIARQIGEPHPAIRFHFTVGLEL